LTTDSPWGEHEIDYVLFSKVRSKSCLTINPHPDEVDEVKWVTQPQLLKMMEDKTLLFSPWFRIICKKWFLGPKGWWHNLNDVMTTNKFCDYAKIYTFDPPLEHLGGAGNAGPIFVSGDSS